MLFTQRAGVLNARLTDGAVKQVDTDLGDLLVDGFAGLQALAVDPDFTTNRRFYTLQGHTGREMQVIAWTIDADYDEATRVVDPLVEGIPIGPGPWALGRPAGVRPGGISLDRDRRRAGGNGRAGPDVPWRQGPPRRPTDGRRGARQSVRRLLAGVRLRLPQPPGPGAAPGHGPDVAGGARPETRRRDQSAGAGGQLRLGPDPGRRHVGLLRLFRRGRRPHDRPGEVPICPPGQMVLGIPHPGGQRGRFSWMAPNGGSGKGDSRWPR